MALFDLIATAIFGLEAVVAHEVKGLGYDGVKVENARVPIVCCRSTPASP